MNRFKIEVFKFNNKAEKEILFERLLEVSADFSSSLIIDYYLKVFKTLYPSAAGISFHFM